MKPSIHSRSSVRKFHGKAEDYHDIHNFFDQTKAFIPDMRHRLILHNSWGIFLCEQIFGIEIKNSSGKMVPVRSIAEQHVLEDLGRIPTLEECMKDLPAYDWVIGGINLNKLTIVDDPKED